MDNIKKIIKEALIANNIKSDCGCGCHGRCSKAPILNENLNTRIVMTENMNYIKCYHPKCNKKGI
jgi:hypothetical protein